MSSSFRHAAAPTYTTVFKQKKGNTLTSIFRLCSFVYNDMLIPYLVFICAWIRARCSLVMKMSFWSSFILRGQCYKDDNMHSVCLHSSAAVEPSHISVFWCYCASLLLNFLLCLCSLLQAYVHPTHTSHQPPELRIKQHTAFLHPAGACCFGVQASALQGYSQLLLLFLLMTH